MAIKPGTPGWNVKPGIQLPPGDIRGKVNFKPEQFDQQVTQQGVRVRVSRSSFCPRVASIDGAEHDIDCPLCHGSNFVDCYPLDTYAFIQGQKLEKRVSAEGLVDGNTVSATFLQGVDLQYFTLVEVQDFTEPFIERVKRQDGKLDVLKYPCTRVNLAIDYHGRQYTEGSDFQLDLNGNIVWKDNRGPAAGTIYSVNYETLIRFRAVKAEHVNRFAQVTLHGTTQMLQLNQQWQLAKEYLVVRKNRLGQVIPPNKIRDADTPDSTIGADGDTDNYVADDDDPGFVDI